MGDVFGVLLTVVLLAANAFFVGAEFALISARRDRLEALAEQGRRSAVTVIRAGENLSLMLAGAQLGITVCSILLGRIAEPAIAHLLETPFHVFGVPAAVLHTVSFIVALTLVVVLHVVLGEMVPKNIAIAGPESTAMLLIPPYLIWMRVVHPLIAMCNWCANITLRAAGVEVRDELDIAVSTVELSEMIAESVSKGLDPEEHTRLTRALQIRNRAVADIAMPLHEIHAVPVVAADRGPASVPSGGPWPKPATPASRSPTRPDSSDTCISRTCSHISTIRTRSSTDRRCAHCRGFPPPCRCPRRYHGCGAATATSPWSAPSTAP